MFLSYVPLTSSGTLEGETGAMSGDVSAILPIILLRNEDIPLTVPNKVQITNSKRSGDMETRSISYDSM